MSGRLRAHDWAATPLGSIETWPDRLRLMVEQVLASPLVSSLVCGPERLLIFNDAAARLCGHRHLDTLGRPLPEVFPDGWEAVAPLYERAFAGEAVEVAAMPLDLRGKGDPHAATFDATLVPVRDTTGEVLCVHMTGQGVEARLRVEAAMRESEERQAFLLRLSDTLRPVADPVDIQRTATRMPGEHLKASRVFYVEVAQDGDTAAILGDYTDGVASRAAATPCRRSRPMRSTTGAPDGQP